MEMTKGIALITGASTGIGAVYADRLAARNHDLILVARSPDRLETVAAKIRKSHGRNVEVIVADLGSRTGISSVEKVLREDSRISVLVNNAGIGATQAIVDSDPDAMSRMIGLNVDALTRLTIAAVPGFISRQSGTIINIASIAAIAPEVLNGVYGGTKAFVLAFSQSLRAQLADKGIRIQVVMPGATATPFWSISGTPLERLPSEIVMSSSDMVDAALAGLDQGEFVTIPALPDTADWAKFEAARQALMPNLSKAQPAERYRPPVGPDHTRALRQGDTYDDHGRSSGRSDR
jgi:short-subunit dehydrogenase